MRALFCFFFLLILTTVNGFALQMYNDMDDEFTIGFPEGWIYASADEAKKSASEFLHTKELPSPPSSKMAVMAVSSAEDGYRENINVQVLREEQEITEGMLYDVKNTLVASLKKDFPDSKVLQLALVRVSGARALKLVWKWTYKNQPVQTMQAVVPWKKKMYVISGTCLQDDFYGYEQAFLRAVHSFRPGPPSEEQRKTPVVPAKALNVFLLITGLWLGAWIVGELTRKTNVKC